MVSQDVERWTATARYVYNQLGEDMDAEEAAELTEAVLAEIGRDRRTEQIGEQRRGYLPDASESSGGEEEWRSKDVSDKQREILLDHGYEEDDIDEMTRGEASDELDDILGEE
ncbi:MAG: hypothetical protein SVU88_01655 [Candidatus Nanohaloarchaea archaeon]|nr:hypothetical protein [Candidatus Nanohaloarchaea archaeon]